MSCLQLDWNFIILTERHTHTDKLEWKYNNPQFCGGATYQGSLNKIVLWLKPAAWKFYIDLGCLNNKKELYSFNKRLLKHQLQLYIVQCITFPWKLSSKMCKTFKREVWRFHLKGSNKLSLNMLESKVTISDKLKHLKRQ